VTPESTTERLAALAVSTTFEQLPPAVIHAALRSLVDSIGVMVAGSTHPAVDTLLSALAGTVTGAHTVVARHETLDLVNATVVNGTMAHVLDFDDTILPTRCHISAPMVSALLGASELTAPSGRDVLAAFVVGFELVTRCAEAVYEGNTGWHGTGIMGPIGVAAAVGRVLGSDELTTAHGFALAANHASGLRASFGSMAKSLNLGRAGGNGLWCAVLASRGFTGGSRILDEDGGFLHLFAREPEHGVLSEGLGSTWAVERNGFKPYPCGFVAHAAIDAALRARDESEIAAEEVEAILLSVAPETTRLTTIREPRTGLEAKFSVFHAVAAAFIDGHLTTSTFSDRAVHEGRYRPLAARVTATTDPGLRQDEARLEIVGSSGRRFSVHVEHALGSESNPMSDEQLTAKFRRNVEPVLGDRVDALLDVLWSIDERKVAELLALLRPDSR
jgi:2-methylcitrate dehydratase PrpD